MHTCGKICISQLSTLFFQILIPTEAPPTSVPFQICRAGLQLIEDHYSVFLLYFTVFFLFSLGAIPSFPRTVPHLLLTAEACSSVT